MAQKEKQTKASEETATAATSPPLAPEAPTATDALAAAITSGVAADVTAAAEGIDDTRALERLYRAEREGKGRKSVLAALEGRLAELGAPGRGAGLFTVRRVKGARTVTAVPVHTSPRTTVVATPVGTDTYNVDRAQAQAFVATGAFEIAPGSKAKLKG